jgi:hypothetical protein
VSRQQRRSGTKRDAEAIGVALSRLCPPADESTRQLGLLI